MLNTLKLQLTFSTFEYMDTEGALQGINHAADNYCR